MALSQFPAESRNRAFPSMEHQFQDFHPIKPRPFRMGIFFSCYTQFHASNHAIVPCVLWCNACMDFRFYRNFIMVQFREPHACPDQFQCFIPYGLRHIFMHAQRKLGLVRPDRQRGVHAENSQVIALVSPVTAAAPKGNVLPPHFKLRYLPPKFRYHFPGACFRYPVFV